MIKQTNNNNEKNIYDLEGKRRKKLVKSLSEEVVGGNLPKVMSEDL